MGKVRIIGLIQPFNDAIKLFSKELVLPNLSNNIQFFFAPMIGLLIVLIIFYSFPFFEINFCLRMSIIFIYIILIFYLSLRISLRIFIIIKINQYFIKILIFI